MAGYYERRQSKAAKWCLRFAIVAIPFFVLTVYLHRSAAIETRQAFWLIAFGIGMLVASLVFGLRAASDLWEKGYKGGRATVNGIAISTLLLVPFGIQLFRALEHPQLSDVATDVFNPPRYLQTLDAEVQQGDSEPVYDDYTTKRIVSSYPGLVSRRYEAPPERVVVSVLEILDRWNWQTIGSVNLPKPEPEAVIDNSNKTPVEEGEIDQQPANTEELAGSEQELSSIQSTDSTIPDILLQTKAKSLIMKLPSEIMIRLSASEESTLVDMRSSSNWGRHDFGGNAENITQFLKSLDEALAGLAGES